MDTDKITTGGHKLVSNDQRNPGNSWYIARKRCGAPQRYQLYEQNRCVDVAQTKRQEPAAAFRCMLFEKNKEYPFFEIDDYRGQKVNRLQ